MTLQVIAIEPHLTGEETEAGRDAPAGLRTGRAGSQHPYSAQLLGHLHASLGILYPAFP